MTDICEYFRVGHRGRSWLVLWVALLSSMRFSSLVSDWVLQNYSY